MLLRYAVAGLIGAVLFTILGFFVYAAGRSGISFGFWIERPLEWWPWPLIGVLVGVGLNFLARR